MSISVNSHAVCVYCGASSGSDDAYAEAARTLGRALAARGHPLVYGGGGVGLMGETARAVLSAGGHVTGVIPQFLKAREVHLRDCQEMIVTHDMHERKMIMFQRADAFVALPGGIGTLEELIEMLTWAQLGRHKKPILIADIGGFWSPLLALFSQMQKGGFLHKAFIPESAEARFLVVRDAAAIVPALERALTGINPNEQSEEILKLF